MKRIYLHQLLVDHNENILEQINVDNHVHNMVYLIFHRNHFDQFQYYKKYNEDVLDDMNDQEL